MTVSERYTAPAIAFHWAIAALIATNVCLAWSFDYFSDANARPLIDLHKSIGITVLGLAILRLTWRATHPAPALPSSYRPWERRLAHAVHITLYVLIFAMPLSGWLHDSAWKGAPTHPLTLFGFIPWFRIGPIENLDPATKEHWHSLFSQLHTSLAYVIYAMFVLHVAGALKHQFVDRERELQRMLP